jgi:RyR domain-containing protein
MKLEEVAQVCHEANKAYCESLGDFSQVHWNEAPEWQRDSAISGVRFHLDNPLASPSASHDNWLEQKRREGWSYGEVKDVEKKEHPCFVQFYELPVEQQAKDHLFRGIVRSLAQFIHQGAK